MAWADFGRSDELFGLVPLHSGFDRLRPGEPWDHWLDPKYDLLELSLLNLRPEHRSACQRSLPDLAASGANLSKPLCRGTRLLGRSGAATLRLQTGHFLPIHRDVTVR